MDYRLEVFRCVAESQSISAAARKLRISQPAVTQHIKLLEEAFPATLFTRSRSGVSLTESGAILLAHARRIAQLDEEVAEKLRRPETELGGRLRLGVSTTVGHYYLPRVLASFKERYPAVDIQVALDNSEATIGALLAQRIDLGLIEAPCRRRDLRVQSFFDDEIVIIAPPGDPMANKRGISLKQLATRPFIVREQGSGTRKAVEEAWRRQGGDVGRMHIVQEYPSTEAIKRMVAAGQGLGFVSRLSLAAESATGSLAVLDVRGLKVHRPFSVILPLGADPIGLRQVFVSSLGEPARKT